MTTAAIDPNLAHALAPRPPVDTESAPYFGLSAALHTAFLLLAMVVPPGAAHMELDGVSQQDRFVQIATTPQREPPSAAEDAAAAPAEADSGQKHAGEPGEAGAEDAPATSRRMAIEGPPDNPDPRVARERDEHIAKSVGVEAVFRDQQVDSMWGSGATSVGTEAITAMGNMDGAEIGPSSGVQGWATKETGRGGDNGDDSFGMENVGTKGKGGGGRDDDYGKDEADMGDKDDIGVVVPAPPIIDGPLDKEIIRRVVRRHRRELSYCYQQELQRNRTLGGEVVMRFMISAQGSVVSASVKRSTLNSGAVEACLGAKIRRWNFPAPKGGSLVTVNYPFRFSRQ